MINCWRVIVIFCLASSIFTEAVNACSVQPTATVVTVGERVSLNCTANGDFSISAWQIGTDVNNKTVVYKPSAFGINGTVRTQKYVADGYFVTDEAENRASLLINQIHFSQAGLYVCQCGDQLQSIATTTVVVLARVSSAEIVVSNASKCSAGKCVVNESIICKTDGNPGITLFEWWQIQQNGSKMQIGDGSQRLVLNEVGQFAYQCQAYNKIRGVTYNATSKEFTIIVTGRDAYQVIALPIGIAVACVIIAILSATAIILYRKFRQRSASDAMKVHTEDSPALYAALDVPTASEEPKRETYTAIQFPIQTQQDLGGDYVNIDFSCEYETVN